MKVLMINSVCGTGSTGRICTDLADELIKAGHTVMIAYGRGVVGDKYSENAYRIGNETDVKLHAGLSRIFDCSGFLSKKATVKFIEWIKQYNPDVIHLHNLHGYYIHIPTLFDYLKTCGKRIIWTLHDSWAFSGHSGTCDKVQCTKWKTGCGKCPLKSDYPQSLLDKSARNRELKKTYFTGIPDLTIVTPSKWLCGWVQESFLKEYPVIVIPNGVNTNVFRLSDSDFKKNNNLENFKLVLSVSNIWHKYKGYDDLLELSKMLDDRFKVVIVGLSQKQLDSLPSNTVGIKRTQNTEELVDIYNAADVFVNMTYCDTFPTVNLEALCCGTPVITYNTGGSTECIEKQNGITSERGNVAAVAKAIETLCFDKKTDASIVSKNAMSKYNKEIFCERYINLYNGEK